MTEPTSVPAHFEFPSDRILYLRAIGLFRKRFVKADWKALALSLLPAITALWLAIYIVNKNAWIAVVLAYAGYTAFLLIYNKLALQRSPIFVDDMIRVSVDDEGIYQSSSVMDARWPWKSIDAVMDEKGMVVFVMKGGHLVYIPDAAFPDMTARGALLKQWQQRTSIFG